MKIAVVNNNYQLGGAETVARQVHEGMAKLGHRSSLMVSEGKRYPWGKGVKPLYPRSLSWLDQSRWGAHVQMRYPRYKWTDRSFRALADSDYDLINLHSFHGIYASLDSLEHLARRKPVVWTFHRFWGVTGGCDHPGNCDKYLKACGDCPRVDEFPLNGKDDTREQLAAKIAQIRQAPLHIVSPSQHLADRVTGSLVGNLWNVSVVPNSVDPAAFQADRKGQADFCESLGIPSGKPLILVVNRDFKDGVKGFDTIRGALRGWEEIDCRFVFAGLHSEYAAEQCGGGDRYFSYGYVSDRSIMAKLYEACDVFLYASPGENFPCVILEAMSSECCVVSTPTDGVLEQIEDGRTGYLAETFDPSDLRSALSAALADPEERVRRARCSREDVLQRFSEEKMAENYLRVFERSIAEYADYSQSLAEAK